MIGILFLLSTVTLILNTANGQQGVGGQRGCGVNETHQCLSSGAHCAPNNRCVCNEGFRGNGYLSCYPGANNHACTLINDPILETFSGEQVDLPVPCRYHAANYVVREPTQDEGDWKCRALVSGFNERVRGKIFVRGFDVRVSYIHGAQGAKEFSLRAKGVFTEGAYEFEREVKTPESAVWEPLEEDSLMVDFLPFEHNINFNVSTVENRIELDIPFCALTVHFRPVNPNEGLNQKYMPGLSIVVSDGNHIINWANSAEQCVCLNPNVANGAAQVAQRWNLPTQHAFIFQTFIQSDHQIFPGASPECHNVKTAAELCTDIPARQEAMRVCSFVLKKPHFVYCWEGSNTSTGADILLELFKACLSAFCSRDVNECLRIRNQISRHLCGKHASPALINHSCSFNN